VSYTLIRRGAALGANSTIRCGITVGEWAMVGSGSVVTRDVPDHGLVFGNPARLRGFACYCGEKLEAGECSDGIMHAHCPHCNETVHIPVNLWEKIR